MTTETRFFYHPTFLLALMLGFVFFAGPAAGAPPLQRNPPDIGTSAESLQATIKEIEASTDIEEAVRNKIVEQYRQAVRYLESARADESRAKGFQQSLETAPKQLEEINRKLAKPLPPPSPDSMGISLQTPVPELEQRLVKEQADLTALETKLGELESRLNEEKARPTAIRNRLLELKQNQDDTAKELAAPPPADQSPEMQKARTAALELRRNAYATEIHMLDQELISQAVRVDLIEAQREATARSVRDVATRVKLLEEIVNQARVTQAETAQARAEETQRQAAGKHPAILTLAEQNAQLTAELSQLAADMERLASQRDAMQAKAKQIEQDYQTARKRLEIAGLSEALGKSLAEHRRRLPDLSRFRKDMAARKARIAELGLNEVRVDEELRALRDPEAELDRLVTEAAPISLTPEENEAVREELKPLLSERIALLRQAADTYATYLEGLAALDFAQQRLLVAAATYRSLLDEHLLWIPSARPLGLHTIRPLVSASAWFLSPVNWWSVGESLLSEAVREPAIFVIGLGVFLTLLGVRSRLRDMLNKISQRVGKLSTDSIGLTIQALGITVLLALSWPLLIAFIGWRLGLSLETSEFAKTVGLALLIVAPFLLNIRVFRILCAVRGVAQVHFRWQDSTVALLRHQLDMLLVAAVPAAFVASAAARSGDPGYQDGLSRLAFMVIMLVLAWALQRILNPKTGILSRYLNEHSGGWVAHLRYVWYAVAVGLPLGLVVLAAFGYYLTAGHLARQLVNTLWLLVGSVIIYDLVIRWLELTRRRLAVKRARDRLDAVRATRAAEKTGSPAGEEVTGVHPEEPHLDLDLVDAQTRKLLRVVITLSAALGLWMIWKDVLPALGILDKVSVWHQTVSVDGQQKLEPVTLADLLLVLVYVALAAAAARNLPGVLEIAVLEKLNVSSGSRYAVTTLSQYGIVGIGIVVVFSTLGMSWDNIQWLVAALSVGLGFGLQEIVANFISGIIILFERPIRVGDTVTVGDTSGVVSKIQIRATTIRNYEKQELLVPNKEFITGRLLNWTLSDQLNRIVITVGVAYGSDVKRALRLMIEAAAEHERVLRDPQPVATFEGFGDNALTLLLRTYLDSLEFRLVTISELHEAINRKFSDAGISIAFPQRDIHLDCNRPLEVRIRREDGGSPPPQEPKSD